MIVNKTVEINEADMTASFAMPYSVRYKRVNGSAAGYMQSGDYTPDVRAFKAVVTLRPQPMTLDDAAELANAFMNETVFFRYFDVATRGYRTIEAAPSEPEFAYAGQTDDGQDLFTVTNTVMEEV